MVVLHMPWAYRPNWLCCGAVFVHHFLTGSYINAGPVIATTTTSNPSARLTVTHKRMLASDAKEQRSTSSIHMADAASDTYDCDWALSMLSSDQEALYEIEEAINRIETGGYGKCEITGKLIEAERLAAIPWARFSMEAQRQLEDEGAIGRTKLAERRGLSEASDTADREEETDEVTP